MNKTELIRCIAGEMKVSYSEAGEFLECYLRVMGVVLQHGENVTIHGFGVFTPLKQSERMGRNPRTGEEVMITPRITARFKPAKLLLKLLNIRKKKPG